MKTQYIGMEIKWNKEYLIFPNPGFQIDFLAGIAYRLQGINAIIRILGVGPRTPQAEGGNLDPFRTPFLLRDSRLSRLAGGMINELPSFLNLWILQ